MSNASVSYFSKLPVDCKHLCCFWTLPSDLKLVVEVTCTCGHCLSSSIVMAAMHHHEEVQDTGSVYILKGSCEWLLYSDLSFLVG